VTPILPRSTPEAEGVSSAAIASLVAALDTGGTTHSYMLVRRGSVIAEGWWAPFEPGMPHMMFSVSKSFTATAVGLAIADGLFGLDSLVAELLPDDLPDDVSPNLAAMRVRDLLTMTTGHATDTVELSAAHRTGNWARTILALPVVHEPGSTFVYNSGATYLLSAIVTRATGERLLDYLDSRVLAPLGIVGATWEQSPSGIDSGGWGLAITTEDLAAFGELYRRRGEWNGAQLVPGDWVDQATSFQVPNARDDSTVEGSQGYGFQFWQCTHGAYRADGAFGQLSIVMPEHEAVLALTGGITSIQDSLDLVWEHLLPGFDAPSEPGTHRPLELPFETGAATTDAVTVTIDAGEQSWFTIETISVDATGLTIVDADGTHRIACGYRSWTGGTTRFGGSADQPIAASASWRSDSTWVGLIWLTATPFRYRIELNIDGDAATLAITSNVSFGSTDLATLSGRVTR
jgi:CubicO group peptidase (beta-lactamase class C family)